VLKGVFSAHESQVKESPAASPEEFEFEITNKGGFVFIVLPFL
jgi:hypothetical protein